MSVLFVFVAAAFLFLLYVFSGEDVGYLFRISRHEWFRELRRDYHTSWQQFWKDWRLFKRFARENGPWIYASIFGTIGIGFAVMLLIVNLPHELKASVRNVYTEHVAQNEPTFVTRDDGIDTRTRIITEINPLVDQEAVLVDIRTVGFKRNIAKDSYTPDPPERRIDWNEAFGDFEKESPPQRIAPPAPKEWVVTLDLADVPQLDDVPFEVTSVAVFDVERAFGRLRGDEWLPEDKQRVPRPRPILLEDRHNVVQQSMHERELIERPRDDIRIRPRAAGRDATPGVFVRKSVPHHAVAGTELTYEIEISNPNADTVPKMIVEEVVPKGWQIVDADPVGELVGSDVLRWDIDGLAADQAQRFKIRVLVGGDEAAESRTILTVGAAVESLLDVGTETIEPVIPPEPAPIIPNSNKWQASDTVIEPPIRDLTAPPILTAPAFDPSIISPPVTDPPTLAPPTIANRTVSGLDLDVVAPSRVGLGDLQVKFIVRNTGPVAINDARVVIWMSKELSHPQSGRSGANSNANAIQHRVGSLAPNQSRTLIVNLRANAFGRSVSKVQLRVGSAVYDRGEARFTIGATGAPVTPASNRGWRAR